MQLKAIYNEDTDTLHVGRIILMILAVLALIWALTVAVWGIGVATAGIAGRGNAHKIIQAPTNRIFQYQHFFDLHADVQTDVTALANASKQAAAHRKDTAGQPDPVGANATEQARLDSIVTGLANHCSGLANQYNADAQEYTRAEFLSNKLPAQIDPTICQEPTQ